MAAANPRNLRPSSREVRPLEVEPLMLSWLDGEVVRATLRHISEVPVIALGGPLDATALEHCRRSLEAALRARPRFVIVDLSAVTDSDAACIPLLGAMRRKAAWHGAQLWLAALPDHVRATLHGAGVLPLYPNERTATRAVDIIRLQQQPSRAVPVPEHLSQRPPSSRTVHRSVSPYPSQTRTA